MATKLSIEDLNKCHYLGTAIEVGYVLYPDQSIVNYPYNAFTVGGIVYCIPDEHISKAWYIYECIEAFGKENFVKMLKKYGHPYP
jgi:phage pi2 protein 07